MRASVIMATFTEIGIRQRMESLGVFYLVTLTYVIKVKHLKR